MVLKKQLLSYYFHLGFRISPRAMSSTPGPVETSMREKLQKSLETSHLQIINESHMHNVPEGSETHFKVVVVSNKFEGLPSLKRHRLVNDVLRDEIRSSVHALSIVAKTPDQWEASQKFVESSPNCMGGFGK
ncbi:bolA-like protein DDB_G0274169 [Epargyreus clarus]|uniref:bolA-like protein DDB_G0274169 n=1 Tax=Epargyreus clarus TaxID=520877 RepID=UPI003C2F09EE